MLIWEKKENNILVNSSSKLPVWALTQLQLSQMALELTAWKASLKLTMLSATRSAELQSESMLPQAANQVSPSEDEYSSFEMRVAQTPIKLRCRKLQREYDQSPIKYTTDLTICIVSLRHNRVHKHFYSHNYFLVFIFLS